jgi:FkbM family methyltransferase
LIYYFKKLIQKIFDILIRKFHRSNFSSNSTSIFLENCIAFIRKKKIKFQYKKKENIFTVTEGNITLNFFNKIRGINLYRDGLINRGNFIFSSYCLNQINFSQNDIVIDCGANFGDLMLKLSNYIKPSNYIAIEPNPDCFYILKKNVNNKSVFINKALGNINKTLPFYVSTEEADSSLVKPSYFTNEIKVSVVRLDSLIKELNINKIKLLKIEAEGYEPEILEGLGNSINICEYIAVDGGYERGEKQEQTFTTISNYLLKNDFEMKDIYFPWYRALFVKKGR